MTNLITELEMKEYLGKNQAVFPEDAIITPAARDWANAHRIRIVRDCVPAGGTTLNQKSALTEHDELLTYMVKTTLDELKKDGDLPPQDFIVEVVIRSLVRLGCRVV